MDKKLKVLLAGPMPPPTIGGISALIATLLSSRLPELVLLDTFDIGEPTESYVPGRISPRRLATMIRQLLGFSRRVRLMQPDVVHIHAPASSGLAKASLFLLVSRSRGIPTVIHLHIWPEGLRLFGSKSTERLMVALN